MTSSGVIQTIILQRAFLETGDEHGTIWAGQMKDAADINNVLHDLGLFDVPGNAVQHETINVRFKNMSLHAGLNPNSPELHRDLIRHQLTSAGIIQEGFADRGTGINRAKYIATSAMEKAGNVAENFTLSAFAAAGSSENEIRLIFFHVCSLREGDFALDYAENLESDNAALLNEWAVVDFNPPLPYMNIHTARMP